MQSCCKDQKCGIEAFARLQPKAFSILPPYLYGNPSQSNGDEVFPPRPPSFKEVAQLLIDQAWHLDTGTNDKPHRTPAQSPRAPVDSERYHAHDLESC